MKSWKLTHFTFILVHFLPATKTSLGPGSFLTNNFFFISNFRRALNVVCFLLGDSPASELYMPTFRNTLFHLHRQVGVFRILHAPTCLWRWNRQSVPKRRHIKFSRRGITQKKAYIFFFWSQIWSQYVYVMFACTPLIYFVKYLSSPSSS